MVPKNSSIPLYRTSVFPSGQALAETRRSLGWKWFHAWQSSRKIRRAARIDEGRQRARALLKRLDAPESSRETKQRQPYCFIILWVGTLHN
jgi:hypothetical protein